MGRALDRLLEWVERACFLGSGAAIILIVVMISLDMLLRSGLNISLDWLSDIPVYLNISIGFLAMPYLFRKRQHIVVDLLTNSMSKRMQTWCYLVVVILAEGLFAVLFWTGLGVALTSYQLGNTSYGSLHMPLWIPEMVVPLGSLLLFCEGLSQIVQTVRDLFAGQKGAAPAPRAGVSG